MKRIMLALLIGCAPPTSLSSVTELPPTLEVENSSIDTYKIYSNGNRVGTVMPGRTECIKLRAPEDVIITVSAVGGDSYNAPKINVRESRFWRMVISMNPRIDIYTLSPSTPC